MHSKPTVLKKGFVSLRMHKSQTEAHLHIHMSERLMNMPHKSLTVAHDCAFGWSQATTSNLPEVIFWHTIYSGTCRC